MRRVSKGLTREELFKLRIFMYLKRKTLALTHIRAKWCHLKRLTSAVGSRAGSKKVP
jgi:hypothetical protein